MGEISDVIGGGTPASADPTNFSDDGVPWITPADLSRYRQKRISRGARGLTEKGLANSSARLMPPGAVLLSSRAPVGYVAIAGDSLATNQGFKSFVLQAGLHPDYFYYYLLRARELAVSLASGTTFLELSGKNAARLAVPLAPLREQRRVVEAIETLLPRLDEAEAALERVQRNLKRYRAAVLRVAVEGRLVPTEAALARAERRDYEPASELLKRILAERRRRWEEAELARLKAAGKCPKDDRWKAKYEDAANPPTGGLATLPKGWCWATVDSLADVKGGITKNQARRSSEPLRRVPYLRVANVQRGSLDLTEMATIPATEAEIEELRLLAGDVLFNEGGDRDKLGRGWIWRGQLPECIHQNHVFRARLRTPDVFPEYLSWYGNSGGQRYFFEQGKQTTNLASINLTKLKRLPVPLPPLMEQERIVAEVQRLLSIAGATAHQVEAGLQRCTRLRQSILKWAFEGKLVDRDPNDEPASVLLERIRAERPAQDQTLVGASRGGKTTMR